MKGSHKLCCGRRPDGPAAGPGAREMRASWTKVSEAAETIAIERSFLLAMSSVGGGG